MKKGLIFRATVPLLSLLCGGSCLVHGASVVEQDSLTGSNSDERLDVALRKDHDLWIFGVNALESAEGQLVGEKPEGHWRFFSGGNTLVTEGKYEEGLREGMWVEYFPDKSMLSAVTYSSGEKDGLQLEFAPGGHVIGIYEYVDGGLEGYGVSLTEDGQLESLSVGGWAGSRRNLLVSRDDGVVFAVWESAGR